MILLLIVTLYYYIAYIISLKLFLLIYICYTRLWVWIPLGVRSTTLCDKVCQLLITGLWFSPVSSTNKTDCHDITEILLKVALNTIKLNQNQTKSVKLEFLMWFREGGGYITDPPLFLNIDNEEQLYSTIYEHIDLLIVKKSDNIVLENSWKGGKGNVRLIVVTNFPFNVVSLNSNHHFWRNSTLSIMICSSLWNASYSTNCIHVFKGIQAVRMEFFCLY